ncbi:trypsin-like peptidase domain-containing protein [candidate division KSB1 bacterium]|nr:trypsin-like peptidase domain-containing protein [candidate division KSB1 bacterium]
MTFKWYHIVLLFSLLPIGCSQSAHFIEQSQSINQEDRLTELRRIEKSVLKIICTAYYKNFYYNRPKSLTAEIPQDQLLSEDNYTSSSVAATGLILYQDNYRAMLLSCFHVFDFADTVRSYYLDKDNHPSKYLNQLSIRTTTSILVFHKNGRSTHAELLSHDRERDVALITTEPASIALVETPFLGTFYNNDIELGDEVYMMGFPKGFLMLTRGLASPSPNKNKFLVDASFNQGFSGGVVVRFKDHSKHLEYVGMSNSVSYTSEYVLAPSSNIIDPTQFLDLPYDQEPYLRELKVINYGITFVQKSESVIDFIKDNTDTFRNKGIMYKIHESK